MAEEFFQKTTGDFHITAERLGSADKPEEVPKAPWWGYDVYLDNEPFLTVRILDSISEDSSPTVPRGSLYVQYHTGSRKTTDPLDLFRVLPTQYYHGVSRRTIDQLVRDQLDYVTKLHMARRTETP